MSCRLFSLLILLTAICTLDSFVVLKQCPPKISLSYESPYLKRTQAVKKFDATDKSMLSYSRRKAHYCAASSTSFVGDEGNLHSLKAPTNKRGKGNSNAFPGLEVSLQTLQPFLAHVTVSYHFYQVLSSV